MSRHFGLPPTLYRRDKLRERAAAILITERTATAPDWITPSPRVMCNCGAFQGLQPCPTPDACERPEIVVRQSPVIGALLVVLSVAAVVAIGVALVLHFVKVNS